MLVNVSFAGRQPTGLAVYALNIVPHLAIPGMTVLAAEHHRARFGDRAFFSVPSDMTPEQGKQGHLRRLLWTQFRLPQIYRQQRSPLLFSPIPEAPLGMGCRFVTVVHDLIPLRFPNWKSPLTHYFRYWVPLVLQQAEHIICNSESTARDVCQHYGISASKVTAIPLGYDANHFRPVSLNSEAAHLPYFLYVGRHDPYKNLHRLIDAFAAIAPHTDASLYIGGSADPRFTPDLATHAQEKGVANRVKFLDYVCYADLPMLYSNAIALVFPSLWEGFGFPVLEAMACGTPVIASNQSSLPEVAGEAAILIDPNRVEPMADAMRQVVEDSQLRSQLRQRGLAQAQTFSWQKAGRATGELLLHYL